MQYAKAIEQDPNRPDTRSRSRARSCGPRSSTSSAGSSTARPGRPDLAIIELEQTTVLDPTNDYAVVELRKAHEDQAKLEADRRADSQMEKLKKKAKGQRAVTPMLEPRERPAHQPELPAAEADQADLPRARRRGGDQRRVRPAAEGRQRLDRAARTSSSRGRSRRCCARRTTSTRSSTSTTILIAADTPQNRKTYEDLVIRTFFLSNADVTEVANALRALLQTTRISVNKAENSITLRDTSDKVAVAERIVEQNDKQVAEVVVDVELLQINATKAQNLGTQFAPRAITAPPCRRRRHHEPRRRARAAISSRGTSSSRSASGRSASNPADRADLHQGQHGRPSCSRSPSSASPRARRHSS
jgi:hypothetical protein